MKDLIELRLKEIESRIKFLQDWNNELRAQQRSVEINEMKLHYLDGQREILEELSKVSIS